MSLLGPLIELAVTEEGIGEHEDIAIETSTTKMQRKKNEKVGT